eukprot:CAMPEP_0119059442 /NCGR_PEP_ID=MMETSP1178-20130426/3588_1 /TAXON_ID=33656 /ORGANISM="unid sp, Strain CCMP2000" /LENGTH=117 /DNA_ID=CAMNT_0007040477 /DNA_START=179 /DNA_END=532 /DNA_ORIENTATION=-
MGQAMSQEAMAPLPNNRHQRKQATLGCIDSGLAQGLVPYSHAAASPVMTGMVYKSTSKSRLKGSSHGVSPGSARSSGLQTSSLLTAASTQPCSPGADPPRLDEYRGYGGIIPAASRD